MNPWKLLKLKIAGFFERVGVARFITPVFEPPAANGRLLFYSISSFAVRERIKVSAVCKSEKFSTG